jgi:peptidyl-prolyl cis-trans isomerase SurA
VSRASEFRLELRRQLTLQRLREREVDARVRVSEPEIDQFLREQPAGRRPGPHLS